ncbi:elongation of very long chain fatty acids protein 6 isoform X2 [Leucoraja erinacea]|uniref:elongation of very long chain fatty acids protein 6 isoform X2 n=1 Tax=Leucoraja erinaceus TaxID=7782 RepID=UPI0024583048|nr:elongation of very long chain fatty acids protein 6 isoform X2 [Leucoraja erinacea]
MLLSCKRAVPRLTINHGNAGTAAAAAETAAEAAATARARLKFLTASTWYKNTTPQPGIMSVLALQEYEFERQFNEREAIQWMQENCIIGAVRTGAYMVYILTTSGLKQSVCDQGFYNGPISKFWAYAFVLSKAPELGDTMFIILRKQKLIFLHWYHHITVLLYSWYSYKDMVAGGGWFMTMNYGVHAVMYSYYALRAAGFRVSRKFAMFITMTQITQMILGCVVNYLVYEWMQQGQCPSHMHNIVWSSLMYLSYFVLFCQFFHGAYLSSSTGKALKAN